MKRSIKNQKSNVVIYKIFHIKIKTHFCIFFFLLTKRQLINLSLVSRKKKFFNHSGMCIGEKESSQALKKIAWIKILVKTSRKINLMICRFLKCKMNA